MVGFYDVTKFFKDSFPKCRVMASVKHIYNGKENTIFFVVSDLRSFRLVVAYPFHEITVSKGLSKEREAEILFVLDSKYDRIKRYVS